MRHLFQALRLMLTFWRMRYLVEINLKSGNKMMVWAYQCSLSTWIDDNKLTKINIMPCIGNIMYIDLDAIESVTIVRSRGWVEQRQFSK